MEIKELNKRINQLSINARKYILNNIGLSKDSYEILCSKYIDQMKIYDMCDVFNYDEKTINYKISKAKKELNRIIENEYPLMDNNLKEYINLIIKD